MTTDITSEFSIHMETFVMNLEYISKYSLVMTFAEVQVVASVQLRGVEPHPDGGFVSGCYMRRKNMKKIKKEKITSKIKKI